MQTALNPTLDANAAHPIEIRADDPRHLGNLTKKMSGVNSQVAADTHYDPQAPPRVDMNGKPVKESFVAYLPPSEIQITDEFAYMIGAGALVVLVAIMVILGDSNLRLVLSKTKHGYTMLLVSTIMSAITLIYVRNIFQMDEVLRWYPNITSIK